MQLGARIRALGPAAALVVDETSANRKADATVHCAGGP